VKKNIDEYAKEEALFLFGDDGDYFKERIKYCMDALYDSDIDDEMEIAPSLIASEVFGAMMGIMLYCEILEGQNAQAHKPAGCRRSGPWQGMLDGKRG